MDNFRIIFTVFALIVAWLLPLSFAGAQIATPAPLSYPQTVIDQLGEQIKILQTEIKQLESELAITKSELTEVKAELTFTKILRHGVAGDDVRELQGLLKQFPEIYPEGLVTGYFGTLTEKAVQNFQKKNKIVSFGDPGSTGFGQVGPKTLNKLNELTAALAGQSGTIPLELSAATGIQEKLPMPTIQTAIATATPMGAVDEETEATTTPLSLPLTPAITAPTGSGGGGSGGGGGGGGISGGSTETTTNVSEVSTASTSTVSTASVVGGAFADTAPPVISNIQATNITETSATITWTTNEGANSKVSYALTSLSSATSTTIDVVDSNSVTGHSINLTKLGNNITHYYVVVSTDTSGNTETSSEQSFTTLAPVSNWQDIPSGEYESSAWNGDGYGVVYGWEGKLYFVKFDSNKNQLSSPVVLATAPNYILGTSIVWDGSKYGVAWTQANPTNLRFATVNANGGVLSNQGVSVNNDNTYGQMPALLWDGGNYVLSWYGHTSLSGSLAHFAKVSPDGQSVTNKKSISISVTYPHETIISLFLRDGPNYCIQWRYDQVPYHNVLDVNGDKIFENNIHGSCQN